MKEQEKEEEEEGLVQNENDVSKKKSDLSENELDKSKIEENNSKDFNFETEKIKEKQASKNLSDQVSRKAYILLSLLPIYFCYLISIAYPKIIGKLF
jgi:Flp pilus assembly protein TadB